MLNVLPGYRVGRFLGKLCSIQGYFCFDISEVIPFLISAVCVFSFSLLHLIVLIGFLVILEVSYYVPLSHLLPLHMRYVFILSLSF